MSKQWRCWLCSHGSSNNSSSHVWTPVTHQRRPRWRWHCAAWQRCCWPRRCSSQNPRDEPQTRWGCGPLPYRWRRLSWEVRRFSAIPPGNSRGHNMNRCGSTAVSNRPNWVLFNGITEVKVDTAPVLFPKKRQKQRKVSRKYQKLMKLHHLKLDDLRHPSRYQRGIHIFHGNRTQRVNYPGNFPKKKCFFFLLKCNISHGLQRVIVF